MKEQRNIKTGKLDTPLDTNIQAGTVHHRPVQSVFFAGGVRSTSGSKSTNTDEHQDDKQQEKEEGGFFSKLKKWFT